MKSGSRPEELADLPLAESLGWWFAEQCPVRGAESTGVAEAPFEGHVGDGCRTRIAVGQFVIRSVHSVDSKIDRRRHPEQPAETVL